MKMNLSLGNLILSNTIYSEGVCVWSNDDAKFTWLYCLKNLAMVHWLITTKMKILMQINFIWFWIRWLEKCVQCCFFFKECIQFNVTQCRGLQPKSNIRYISIWQINSIHIFDKYSYSNTYNLNSTTYEREFLISNKVLNRNFWLQKEQITCLFLES